MKVRTMKIAEKSEIKKNCKKMFKYIEMCRTGSKDVL